MKNLQKILVSIFIISLAIPLLADESPGRTFSNNDIKKLAGKYIENNLNVSNPAFVDEDGDGDFDLLSFDKGNVALYRNTGTLENPSFVLENKNYEKYVNASPFISGFPVPLFFADSDGDGDLDMFTVKDKGIDEETGTRQYRVLHAENALNLDTGTLITIILVLVIVLLVLAILN